MLIVGVGNPMRGDDGVGPLVARRLAELLPMEATVVEQCGEGTLLMESWAGEDDVVVIDAVRSGANPGTIYEFDARSQNVPPGFFHYSTHTFGLAEAVELSRAMDMLPDHLTIYGIEGAAYLPGAGLCKAVADAAEDVVQRTLRAIRCGHGNPSRWPTSALTEVPHQA